MLRDVKYQDKNINYQGNERRYSRLSTVEPECDLRNFRESCGEFFGKLDKKLLGMGAVRAQLKN